MKHRRGCDQPLPDQRTTGLSDGTTVRVDRCPTCGAVALHREDHS